MDTKQIENHKRFKALKKVFKKLKQKGYKIKLEGSEVVGLYENSKCLNRDAYHIDVINPIYVHWMLITNCGLLVPFNTDNEFKIDTVLEGVKIYKPIDNKTILQMMNKIPI